MNIIGQRIKNLRKTYNMTQQELGEKLNVTKVSICCYEKGTRSPSLETLTDLSNLFHVSLDYFVGNDSFVVTDNDANYGMKMSNEEINIMRELRKNTYDSLYNKLITDPKRTIELINKKLR